MPHSVRSTSISSSFQTWLHLRIILAADSLLASATLGEMEGKSWQAVWSGLHSPYPEMFFPFSICHCYSSSVLRAETSPPFLVFLHKETCHCNGKSICPTLLVRKHCASLYRRLSSRYGKTFRGHGKQKTPCLVTLHLCFCVSLVRGLSEQLLCF